MTPWNSVYYWVAHCLFQAVCDFISVWPCAAVGPRPSSSPLCITLGAWAGFLASPSASYWHLQHPLHSSPGPPCWVQLAWAGESVNPGAPELKASHHRPSIGEGATAQSAGLGEGGPYFLGAAVGSPEASDTKGPPMTLRGRGAFPGFPVPQRAAVINAHRGAEACVPEATSAARGLISAWLQTGPQPGSRTGWTCHLLTVFSRTRGWGSPSTFQALPHSHLCCGQWLTKCKMPLSVAL